MERITELHCRLASRCEETDAASALLFIAGYSRGAGSVLSIQTPAIAYLRKRGLINNSDEISPTPDGYSVAFVLNNRQIHQELFSLIIR